MKLWMAVVVMWVAAWASLAALVFTGAAAAIPEEDVPCGVECTGGGASNYYSYMVTGIGPNASCWCIYDIYKPWAWMGKAHTKVDILCNHNTSYDLDASWSVDGQAKSLYQTHVTGAVLRSTYKTVTLTGYPLSSGPKWYMANVSMTYMSAVQSKYGMFSPSKELELG